jgi:hypothetical protein
MMQCLLTKNKHHHNPEFKNMGSTLLPGSMNRCHQGLQGAIFAMTSLIFQ